MSSYPQRRYAPGVRVSCSQCSIICDDNNCPCEVCLVKTVCKDLCREAYIYFLRQVSMGKKRM